MNFEHTLPLWLRSKNIKHFNVHKVSEMKTFFFHLKKRDNREHPSLLNHSCACHQYFEYMFWQFIVRRRVTVCALILSALNLRQILSPIRLTHLLEAHNKQKPPVFGTSCYDFRICGYIIRKHSFPHVPRQKKKTNHTMQHCV